MISLGILNGIQWNHIYGPFNASQLIWASGSPRSVQQASTSGHSSRAIPKTPDRRPHDGACGVWSPLRGFARSVDRYYALLDAADAPRKGDLDGRGCLSESALVDWIEYVLDMCIDQIRFMKSMLNRKRPGTPS
jgi:hypothetical protein